MSKIQNIFSKLCCRIIRLGDNNGVKTLKAQINSHVKIKCPGVLFLQRTDGLPQIVSLVCRTAPGLFWRLIYGNNKKGRGASVQPGY